jgi:hypothetical protein
MARPVTPDLPPARRSAIELLRLDFELLCPGHREPAKIARADREALLQQIELGRWPLFG